VTCIRTTPEKLWQALTAPELTQRDWRQTRQESAWKPSASWGAVASLTAGGKAEVTIGRRFASNPFHGQTQTAGQPAD
jgi:uncharacterized protein YndB with AHSA1/START domain